jgi:hypothetical protein
MTGLPLHIAGLNSWLFGINFPLLCSYSYSSDSRRCGSTLI